jgi:hypothetical protein
VIGATPDLHHRGKEIQKIVGALGLAQEDFVILEDAEDVSPYNGRRVRTTFYGNRSGFMEKHLRMALKLLGDPE